MAVEKKEHQYLLKIIDHLQEIFEDVDHPHFIDLKEMKKEGTEKEFLHAISNLVPLMVYNELTGQEEDVLGFNHISNRLIFEFSNPVKK